MKINTKIDIDIPESKPLSDITNIPFYIAGYEIQNFIYQGSPARALYIQAKMNPSDKKTECYKTSSAGIIDFFVKNQTDIDTEIAENGFIYGAVVHKVGKSSNGNTFNYLESVEV